MPTVKLGVLACFLLPASLAVAVEWGRGSTYKPRPMVYVEAAGSRRLVIYNGPTRDCEVAADPYTITTYRNVSMPVSTSKISALIERCQRVHALLYRRNPAAYTLERRDLVKEAAAGSSNSLWAIFENLAIFPGTKWCGQGSVAEHYWDIGYHADADRCCRDHDLCLSRNTFLGPGQCGNGLCNFSPVTRSPCECDKAFVKCLKSAKTRVANALGKVFFNVAGLTCYKFDYPIKRCVEYVDVAGSLKFSSLPMWIVQKLQIHPEPQRPRCKNYELDFTKPKMWQFFETVYDDYSHSLVENARSEEFRSHRRGHSLNLFQQIVFDVFMSFIDPP